MAKIPINICTKIVKVVVKLSIPSTFSLAMMSTFKLIVKRINTLVHDYPPMTILLEDKSKYFNIMETGNANELANLIEESCNKELTYIDYYQDIENSPQI